MWEILGVISFDDPIKSSAARAVGVAHTLGVQLKLMTSDHISIALVRVALRSGSYGAGDAPCAGQGQSGGNAGAVRACR